MSVSWDMVKDFWDYLERYPYDDEEDYDGIHDGGIKGIRSDAPESAKKAYYEFNKMEDEAKSKGIKI